MNARRSYLRLVFAVFALTSLACAVEAGDSGVDLWTVDSMTRVSRTQSAAAGGREVRIEAARNETEPFQVVVTAEAEVLRQATIEVTPLRGPGGAVIREIEIFYEHYVRVVHSSPKSPYKPGLHPDALIPVAPGKPIFQPVTSLPSSGRINQPFWVDVRVPRQIPAGDYSGAFVLTTADGTRKSIPVVLTVWNFELPDKPSLSSLFGLEGPRLERIHGVELGREEGNQIVRAYEDLLADHKLAAEGFYGTLDIWDGDSERVTLRNERKPLIGTAKDVYRHFLDEKSLSTVVIPMWPEWPYPDALGKDRRKAKRYIADHVQQLERYGWADGVLGQCGYIDEPRTKEDYERVREWGKFYNEVEAEYGIRIPMFVTEQPATENEEWGTLDGYVDIWVTYVGDLWDDMHGFQTRKVLERRAAGDEIWLYCGLTPTPYTWEEKMGKPETYREGNPPAWLLDFPPMNHRITAWIAPAYDVSGILYWATIDVREGINPWQRADSFQLEDHFFNGDGFLIYPGSLEGVGFDGPVASMRLKWIRESFEDHAYISMLQDQMKWDIAIEHIRRIARNVGDWDDDSTELFSVRRNLAALLAESGT